MSKALNILIVDDSAMMRAVVKRVVTFSGVDVGDVHEAADGQQALSLIASRAVDVVLTDINMPVMNGVELLREINARGWHHLVRVVVSTDGSAARREECHALGVTLTVEKPLSPEAIRDVLSNIHRG